MRFKTTQIAGLVASAFAVAACSDRDSTAATPDVAAEGPKIAAADTKPMPVETDNTGRNVRDQADKTLTPLDQSNSAPDIDLTQKIRQGITSDDSMSEQARNVKVITQSGVVTLRGPVKTEQERTTIETLAKTAGATRIDNQLEIDRDDTAGEKD